VIVDEVVEPPVLAFCRDTSLWNPRFDADVVSGGVDQFVDGLIKRVDRLAVDVDDTEANPLRPAEVDYLLGHGSDDE
jgi:hypothetical protein